MKRSLLALAALALPLTALSSPAQATEQASGFVEVIGAVTKTSATTSEVKVRYRCSNSSYGQTSGVAGIGATVRTPTGYEWVWGGRFNMSFATVVCDGKTHVGSVEVYSTPFGYNQPISKGERARVFVELRSGCTFSESNLNGQRCSIIAEDVDESIKVV